MDAIVLWGGKLHGTPEWSEKKHKGSEILGDYTVWARVVNALDNSWVIGNIIYCWDPLKKEWVETVPPSDEKFFFKTLSEGMKKIETDERVLVVAWDLPLVSWWDIKELVSSVQECAQQIITFYTTNNIIQRDFPTYNENKKYATFKQGDVVFSNAFFIHKEMWMKVTELEKKVMKDGMPDIMRMMSHISAKTFFHFILLLPYIKSWKLPKGVEMFRRYTSIPDLSRVSKIVDLLLWEVWTNTILPASPVLSIDYDRYYQREYFERRLLV